MAKRKGSQTRPVGGPDDKSTRASRDKLSSTWRKAMRGDERALESLLKLALDFDKNSGEGSAARRLVSRAYMHHARALMARAETAAGIGADALRRKAQGYFYKAVLAKHLELPALSAHRARPAQGCASANAAPAGTQSPNVCLFDPPPGAPTDVIAACQTPASATVQWAAPEFDGGKKITSYRVSISPAVPAAVITYSAGKLEATVAGLLVNNTYTFTVQAINDDGVGLRSLPSNPITLSLLGKPPNAPTGVTATPGAAAVNVKWDKPAETIGNYVVTAYVLVDVTAGTYKPFKKKSVAGTGTSAVFTDLPKGDYKFGVRPFNECGYGPETQTAKIAYTPAPTPVTLHKEDLPSFPINSMLFFDVNQSVLNPTQVQRLMTGALAQANKWRFEYLKAQAVKAAGDALQYEQHIGGLMQMALTKVSTAELLLSPVLQEALKDIMSNVKEVKGLGTSDEVDELLKKVGEAAGNALGLEALIRFLIHEPDIEFWVGLFGGMIDDVAHFDTGLNRTRKFVEDYLGGPGAQIIAAIRKLTEKIDKAVGEITAPLQAAVADVVRGTTKGVEEIYQSFDNPLLAATTKEGVVVLNPPPQNVSGLEAVLDTLKKTLDDIIKKIRDKLNELLDINPLKLVTDLIIIFICLPILAAMVISFVAGPIGAFILAAIVMIAAVELIRLVLRLLTGPLLGVLEDAQQKVNEVVGQLESVFARTANLLDNPEPKLFLLASNLLEMKSLLPEAFLTDAAALLGEARRALLNNTTELALAAERALGVENGTAFDVISTDYKSGLTPAPQMPGGADPTLFAGAAMLRDLNQLERQRIRVVNGKELLVTQRLSLFRLLGGVGDPATATGPTAGALSGVFFKNGKMMLHLDEATLLDQNYPGLYRALISEIRPIGIFAATPAGSALPVSLPLTVTHTGPSRTRVKRSANPEAPPIAVPRCLKLDLKGFLDKAFGSVYDTSGKWVSDELDTITTALIDKVVNSYKNPDWNDITGFKPPSITTQVTDMLLKGVHYDPADPSKFLKGLPDAFATRLSTASCDLIDPATVAQLTRDAVLRALASGGPLPEPHVEGTGTPTDPIHPVYPARSAVKDEIVKRKIAEKARPLLLKLASDTYSSALAYYGPRVAKWGGATFEEDPDLHIRSLGFVTLVQSFDPESTVFNLLPEAATLSGKPSAAPYAPDAQAPVSSASTHQYRPFENRGLGCDLVLSLGTPVAPGMLIDLLLEITVRACFDEDLAAAVKASRSQTFGQVERAKELAAAVDKQLIMPSALSLLSTDAMSLRTFNLSLRAHRDNLLYTATAAAAATGATGTTFTVDGLKIDKGTDVPLKAGEPLRGLAGAVLKTITMEFQLLDDKPTLGALGSMIPLTPESFGTALGDVTSQAGELVGIGVSVIPMAPEKVKSPEDAITYHMEILTNRNQVQMSKAEIDPILKRLLPQLDASHPKYAESLKKRLLMTTAPPAQRVTWEELWVQASRALSAERPHLTLDFGTAVTDKLVYDVIFSLSFRNAVPATTIGPSTI